MNQFVRIEVDDTTATALSDTRRRQAVERLVQRLVHPAGGEDPLSRVLEETAATAAAQELTEADIDAELAVYNTERRD